MNREIELKLECAPDVLEDVRRMPSLAKFKHGRVRKRLLRSTYFDTEDFSLLENGMALRLRDTDGARIQTLKTARQDRSAASERHEYETRLPANAEQPDLNHLPANLRAKIKKLAGKALILPRLHTDIERIASQLRTEEGDEIELALDSGILHANGREKLISEVELELKQGDPASLYRIALKLAETIPMRLRLASKSEQGLALARGRDHIVVKAETPHLVRNTTVEDAYAVILRQCLMHLISNEDAALDQRSAESLHQMRVALRRLSSAFSVFKRLSKSEDARALKIETRWLAKSLGRARDLDVFVDMLPRAKRATPPELKLLRGKAEKARTQAWKAALRDIRSPRYTRFVLRLAYYISAREWRVKGKARPLRQFAPRALDRIFHKVCDLGVRIENLETDERHALRKRLKKLRYSLSFFSSLYEPDEVKAYLHGLAQMQDLFGSLNDAAVAHATLHKLTQKNAELEKVAGNLAHMLDRRAAKDWRSAQQAWRKFQARRPVWR